MTQAEFKRIALSFPGAHEKLSRGQPSIFIAKKFFTRLRAEDDGIVLTLGSLDERDMLLEADPETFYITDHYHDYPHILARRGRIDAPRLWAMLERH